MSSLGVGAGGEGRWMGTVMSLSQGGGDEDDDDAGAKEVERGRRAVETDSRTVDSDGAGTLRRITKAGDEAEHGTRTRECSSASGPPKRKRTVEAGPLPAGKKRREGFEISDALMRADSVPDERDSIDDEGCAEGIEGPINPGTAENASRTDPMDSRADGPAPASPPPTPESIPAPSDKTNAPTTRAKTPHPDRPSQPPSNQPPSTPAPPPSPKPHDTAATPTPDPTPLPTPPPVRTHPPTLLTKLTTLLTTHLLHRPFPPPLPTPHCAGCFLPLAHTPPTDPDSSVRGPLNTLFHVACMRCATCERVLQGGTSWFERDAEGGVVVSCRKCWRRRRLEAGWVLEEVDVCEMGLGFVG